MFRTVNSTSLSSPALPSSSISNDRCAISLSPFRYEIASQGEPNLIRDHMIKTIGKIRIPIDRGIQTELNCKTLNLRFV